ncbi:MAG: biotin/lipoyl-binding protein [Parachlamydiaceae bacterium]|nr:biotin/lipoyl-binding protein [Parachlamydiaceae bacterium]
MNRNYFKWILLISGLCIVLVAISMLNEKANGAVIPTKQITMRPVSPFKSYISAVGIVEAKSDNIFIGSPVNRVVDKVEVQVGDNVKAGDVLFRLEAHDLKADLETRSIAFENAVANLEKLEALPRAEDVAASAAALKSVQIELNQTKALYDRVAGLQKSGAMSQEEINRRRYAFEQAEAKLQQSQAEFDKIKAGAWKPDLEIARLQVRQAKANLQRAEANFQRTIIQSPLDATILQIKIHEGEFPPSDSSRTPPMIIGNINDMHLRVSINQYDASFYSSSAPAVAFLQGNARVEFPLQFVNLEPYFVTKQNLTNEITEKVDTRVLQVIYLIKEQEQGVYVGQQMDVFIETPPAT